VATAARPELPPVGRDRPSCSGRPAGGVGIITLRTELKASGLNAVQLKQHREMSARALLPAGSRALVLREVLRVGVTCTCHRAAGRCVTNGVCLVRRDGHRST